MVINRFYLSKRYLVDFLFFSVVAKNILTEMDARELFKMSVVLLILLAHLLISRQQFF